MPSSFKRIRKRLSIARFGFGGPADTLDSATKDAGDPRHDDVHNGGTGCCFPRLHFKHTARNQLLAAVREHNRLPEGDGNEIDGTPRQLQAGTVVTTTDNTNRVEVPVPEETLSAELSRELNASIQGFFEREESTRSRFHGIKLVPGALTTTSAAHNAGEAMLASSDFSGIMINEVVPSDAFLDTSGPSSNSTAMTESCVASPQAEAQIALESRSTDGDIGESFGAAQDNNGDITPKAITYSLSPRELLPSAPDTSAEPSELLRSHVIEDMAKPAETTPSLRNFPNKTEGSPEPRLQWKSEALEIPAVPFPMVEQGKYFAMHGPFAASTDIPVSSISRSSTMDQAQMIPSEVALKYSVNVVYTEMTAVKMETEARRRNTQELLEHARSLENKLLHLQQTFMDKSVELEDLRAELATYEEVEDGQEQITGGV